MTQPVPTKAVLDALVAQAKDDPIAQAHLARALAIENYLDDAYLLARKASRAAPNDPEVRRLTAEVCGLCVEAWHFQIVHDEVRNATYEQAIKRAIRPGMRVLEIGTGSGIFAMMAARAGASEVITCEMNVPVADAAKDIIALNGYADRVRVIAKRATDLDPVTDLHGKADLLICEIVTVHLVNDAIHGSIQHAVENLLSPHAQIIPARATARVALAEDPDQTYRRMNMIAGFDLSPFNRLAAPRYLLGRCARKPILRSVPIDLMTHDLRPSKLRRPSQAQGSLTATGGRANGIAEWVALDLDDHVRYENHPCTRAGRFWKAAFYPWDRVMDMHAGERLTVRCKQNGARLSVWADDANG